MKARGTALYPFLPSGPDFATSLRFFQELGFEKCWENGGIAGLRFKDQMITYEVDDLDAYWSAIEELRLADRYTGVKLKQPTDYPWGREIHIIDPSGVCWHVRQSKDS
jgi:hypothetical protein